MANGKVLIDADRCKGCGLCVNVCPSKILTQTHDYFNVKGYHPVTVSNPEKCSGCGACAIICPDVVFTVYRYVRQPQTVMADTARG